MPFVRIDLAQGKPAEYRKQVGEIVYQAMHDTFEVPENDKFRSSPSTLPAGSIWRTAILAIATARTSS
jgi:hypothetical protein